MEATSSDYKELPLHLIDAPAHMVRMSIDPQYVTELANDINANGLLQPIVVCPKAGRYEVIAGHRRFLAVTSIGWAKVMCNIKTIEPKDVAVCRASENLTRVDMTPIEEAKAYKDLHETFEMSLEEIGRRLGKSPGLVRRRMDLLKYSEEMITALHAKKISVGVAESLAGITDPTAQSYYISCAVDNGITCEVARQWVNDWKMAQVHKSSDMDSGDRIPSVFVERKCYVACDTCAGPEDINVMKMLRVCSKCFERIRALLNK